jgi:hypothetical protein
MADRKTDNPLDNLATFDPRQAEKMETVNNGPPANRPASPLGNMQPPALPDGPLPTSMETLWQEAHRETEQLRIELAAEKQKRRELERKNYELEAALKAAQEALGDLDQERQVSRGLDRELAALEVQVRDVRHLQESFEREHNMRIELDKKLAALEVKAERAEQWSEQLTEERKVRVELERKAATLEVELQGAKKLDVLLDEERKARMNAQSRAATAEAKLARFEGELMSGQQGEKGFFGRRRR